MIELSTPPMTWLSGPDDADRGDHRGQRQQQRHPGGDESAEGDQQDDQGDRQGCDQGLAEVVLNDLVDLLLGAGVAELAEREARMRLLHGVDGLNGRLDPVHDLGVVARDLKAEQRRVPVARDLARVRGGQRALEVLGVGQGRKPPLHVDRHARNAGSAAVASLLWISTISWACSGAASAIAWSARPDSPTPVWVCSQGLGADCAADHEGDQRRRQAIPRSRSCGAGRSTCPPATPALGGSCHFGLMCRGDATPTCLDLQCPLGSTLHELARR